MNLALFFTRGISLMQWLDQGLIYREKIIYEEHLKRGNLEKIFWFTYGNNDRKIAEELVKKGDLHEAIHVIEKPKFFVTKIGDFLYSLFLPLIHHKIVKQCNVIKSNQADGGWTVIIAAKLFKKKSLIRSGYLRSINDFKSKRYVKSFVFSLIEKSVYALADLGLISSKSNIKYIAGPIVKRDNLILWPNFIDIKKFKPDDSLARMDKFVYVGRLSKEKNLEECIKAFAKTGYSLDIYGFGQLESRLHDLAKQLNAKVVLKGSVSNDRLAELLRTYRFFILPSLFEGMPKALLEAMASGCLCVGTDVVGINEVIDDGINGLLAESTDANKIGEALTKAVAHHSKDVLIQNAYTSINELYSLERVIEIEVRAFKSLEEN